MSTTWDGVPIATDPPYGATVVVYRLTNSTREFLLLHRAHKGPGFEGDWAWTPPAGARQPGEQVEDCANRELLEETGLSIPFRPTKHGAEDWVVFSAELNSDSAITLDDEHDRFEWVSLDEATKRCLPERIANTVRLIAGDLKAI